MWSDLVVVSAPALYDDLRVDSVAKPLHRQALIAELPVEGLVGAVLPGLAWLDQRRFDLFRDQPPQDSAGEEFRTVVRSQVLRSAVHADELGEHFLHSSAADT